MTNTLKRSRRKPPTNRYFDLIHVFPLESIVDEAHLAEAQQVIDRLLRENLDAGGEVYLDVLSTLVEKYEDEHHPIPDAPPADVLRELMATNRLTQSALSRATGIPQSTISDILTEKRSLTPAQMVTMAAHFGLPAGVFLPMAE